MTRPIRIIRIDIAESASDEKGFTLIESLMAIAIISIGLLALAALQSTSISGTTRANKHSIAVLLAENQIETYKNMPYANLPTTTITESGANLVTAMGTTMPAVAIYTRTTAFQPGPVPGSTIISVTVSWPDKSPDPSYFKPLSFNLEINMKNLPRIQFNSGFTLIELLVAIAVSGLVLAGLVQVFTTANRSYTHQDEMATLQQNLRVAKTYLERDIRMAGCGFGSNFFYLGAQVFPLVNTNGGTAGSDSLVITYVDYDDPCNGALPQLTPIAISGSSTPPTITVSENLGNMATPPSLPYSSWTAGVPCAASPFFAVYTRAININSPNILTSDVFVVSGTSGASTLQCPGLRTGICAATCTPPPNSTIRFFSATQLITVTYSINNADNTLTRFQPPAVPLTIADNIEDLQFAFGLDTDGDGIVDAWINNADLNNTQQTQIRQVRISILGRSTNQMPGQAPNTRPLIEDHLAGTASEKYLRELLQFDIKPRNM